MDTDNVNTQAIILSKTIDKCIFSVGPNNHHKQGIRMKTCELII